MKFLAVLTPPYIYHGCSTRKTFWEEKFTGKKDFFQSVNMKNCGRRKVRKHKEIKGSDKIVTLNISAKFDSLKMMETTSSERKGKLGRSGKRLVTALAFKTKVRFSKIQKGKLCHRKCQWEGPFEDYQRFEKIWKITYEKRIPKHEPTPSYFHLVKATCEVYGEIWWTYRTFSEWQRNKLF